jgi:hypothetical protein
MAKSVVTTTPAVFLEGLVTVQVDVTTTSLEAGDTVNLYADDVLQGAFTQGADDGTNTRFTVDYTIPAENTEVELTARLVRGTLAGPPSTIFIVSYVTLPIPSIVGVEGTTS